MKKLLTSVLALVICCVLAVPAFAADYPISGDFVIATEDADCYTIENNTITFLDGAEVTLSGDGSDYVFVVADGAEAAITLNGFTCNRAGTWSSAVTLNESASATIVLADGTVNAITGGQESSAIRVPQGASLTITGSGTLNAVVANSTSSAVCAAIGSQYDRPHGNISILGGVINITIQQKYSADIAAIGTTSLRTEESAGNGIILLSNTTVDCGGRRIGGKTSSLSNVIIVNSTVKNGTVNADNTIQGDETGWTVNGHFNLTVDFEIPAGQTLTIPNGSSLTVAAGVTLTNNGTIVIEGGGVLTAPPGTNLGTVINRGEVKYDSTQVTYTVSPSYTVTIPEKVTLGQTATISVEDVRVAKGSQVEVALTGTSGAGNAFTLESEEGAAINYTVQNASQQAVAINDTVLAVTPESSSSGEATLSFVAPASTDITYAGTYTGTVTFTVSVKDAA